MASRRIRATLGATFIGVALTLTLLQAGGATGSGDASAQAVSESASKKKEGPPPGATTKQVQAWVQEKLTEFNSSCSPTSTIYPCKLTFEWSRVRWMGQLASASKVCSVSRA